MDTFHTLTTTEQDQLDRLANAMMTLPVAIGTWSGTLYNKNAALRAAKADGVEAAEAGRLYFDALGPYQSHLKDVTTKFTAVRTYYYAVTTATEKGANGRQARGAQMLPTATVPEVLAKLQALRSEAMDTLDAFALRYEELLVNARAKLGRWAAEGDVRTNYPRTEAELRARFYIDIGTPKPLQIVSANQLQSASIPAALATQLAMQSAAEVQAKVEAVQKQVIEDAVEDLTQLAKCGRTTVNKSGVEVPEGRISQSLLDRIKVHRDFIRGLREASGDVSRYDEPLAKLDKLVLDAGYAKSLKQSPHRKNRVATAAAEVAKMLPPMADVPTVQVTPVSAEAGEVIMPDLL